MRGNINKRLLSFAFEETLRISLSCKLVPVQYRELEYSLFSEKQKQKQNVSALKEEENPTNVHICLARIFIK